MPDKILQPILSRIDSKDLLSSLAHRLKNSELTSLLLEVFRKRTEAIPPPQLLRDYRANKYAGPVAMDFPEFLAFELELLKNAAAQGFEPLEFSPLCPLGTCSAMAAVDQNKVMSALRGTEVVADITNVMALEICHRRQGGRERQPIHLSSTHRHVRTQVFDFPGFTPHFKVFSLVSGGRDIGAHGFEEETLKKHLGLYLDVLTRQAGIAPGDMRVDVSAMLEDGEGGEWQSALFGSLGAHWPEIRFEYLPMRQAENEYYRGLRFKVYISLAGAAYDIADGGLVDWSRRILQDRKERMAISGMGTELLFKLAKNSL